MNARADGRRAGFDEALEIIADLIALPAAGSCFAHGHDNYRRSGVDILTFAKSIANGRFAHLR